METRHQYLSNSWVLPLALLIYFFNSFLLPEGLTLSLLLTPVWVFVLYRHKMLRPALAAGIPLAVFAVVHFLLGVVVPYYLISLTMISCLIFFVFTGYLFIANNQYNWDQVFRTIAVANFLFSLVALLCLLTPVLKNMVWYMVPISSNIKPIPRLKLFTSEASHYSFWMAPIAIYFFTRAILFPGINKGFTILIICIPLVLSFSLGVLGGMLLSGIPIFIYYLRSVLYTPTRQLKALGIALCGLLCCALIFKMFPGNPLFARMHNIFYGNDTSANGRTFQAFDLAHKIIAQRSYWFGIGPGQLKILGRQLIIQYYNYITVPKSARIPNACAETIVYFGYIGFAIRMGAEVLLFFTTRVYKNPYRLWLFLFVFIYQFTGSYITNISEYIIWILAFSPVFPQLNFISNSKVSPAI